MCHSVPVCYKYIEKTCASRLFTMNHNSCIDRTDSPDAEHFIFRVTFTRGCIDTIDSTDD